jgi:hypothetical protein
MAALLSRKPPSREAVPSPKQVLFVTGVSVLCFMSGRRSHIPHFLIGSFNMSLRGSRRTSQTIIHTHIRYLHCK